MKTINVPSRLWYDNEEKELSFPDRWQVDNLTSPGLEKPGLTPQEIEGRIDNPIDGLPLLELARGKKQAVIVFDDMTRPTPVKLVAPYVLAALHHVGMKKEQIRFIWALGSHGTYDMIAARKKLGDEIVENYRVYNHDAFQNTVPAGKTPGGIELWFNREFMACDLKIGIGCITPHVHVGFGGGAKIILPGVAGIESINQFHEHFNRDPSRHGLGNFDNNIMRAECDAAGDIVELNFKVDCLINRRGEIASLYAGSFRATHAQGALEAKEAYGITSSGGYDIVVANTYAKANESAIALLLARMLLKPDATGTAVLISDAPEGQVPHYVFRSWGTGYGGRHFKPRLKWSLASSLKKAIVLNPQPTPTCLDWVGHAEDVTVVKTWQEVLDILEAEYPAKARVGVIQDGTMQYIKKPA
ncbi:MAG: lactate racemase domain-containing protein [Smithellaceae bacterium]|jgi:nickel-dependent lactate racemase